MNRSLFRILLWLSIALLLSLVALAVDGQEPTPKPRRDRIRLAFLITDAAIRGLDVYSTQRMLSHGGHEMLMPGQIAGNPALMSGLEASDIIGVWRLGKRLAGHGTEPHGAHPELARWLRVRAPQLPAADAAADAPWAIRNLFLEKRTAKIIGPLPRFPATR
jgi:hypothetical protein